ncbi:hypothetical protein [uncultured Legionella sp.]|uniref:hypothetical protein n=1 Tax=uncultured Legionella sp. TaxID=210934 RepID=UPI002619EB1E|nr:hypothetical protein [uncultured Legionella sp.]
MEPVTIALICAASFGAVVAISVFIRQLILSRDKNLNDEAQRKAITQEAGELEKMRDQMQANKRFDSHYKVLGANKDAIIYLDTKIEDILRKKTQLVERYSQVSLKESGAIVDGEISAERKAACDRLKKEIDDEMKFYDSELEHLQKRRASLWDTHTHLQEYLLGQEKARNESLDFIYKQHSGLLEKIYIRHTDHSEHIAKHTIDAGTSSFKMMILAPIQFLLQYFNISTGISFDQSKIEKAAREDVESTESDINDSERIDDEVKSDTDINSDDEYRSKSDDSKEDSDDDIDSETDSRIMFV